MCVCAFRRVCVCVRLEECVCVSVGGWGGWPTVSYLSSSSSLQSIGLRISETLIASDSPPPPPDPQIPTGQCDYPATGRGALLKTMMAVWEEGGCDWPGEIDRSAACQWAASGLDEGRQVALAPLAPVPAVSVSRWFLVRLFVFFSEINFGIGNQNYIYVQVNGISQNSSAAIVVLLLLVL